MLVTGLSLERYMHELLSRCQALSYLALRHWRGWKISLVWRYSLKFNGGSLVISIIWNFSLAHWSFLRIVHHWFDLERFILVFIRARSCEGNGVIDYLALNNILNYSYILKSIGSAGSWWRLLKRQRVVIILLIISF